MGVVDGPLLVGLFTTRTDHSPPALRATVFTVAASAKLGTASVGALLAGLAARRPGDRRRARRDRRRPPRRRGRRLAQPAVCASARTGNVPIPTTAGGTAVNVNVVAAQPLEAAQVLDDRDAGAEQRGVHRALAGAGVVDVDRVDADDGRAAGDERARRRPCRRTGAPGRRRRRCPSGGPSRCGTARPARRRRSPSSSAASAAWPPVASTSTPGTSTTRSRSSPARSWPSAKRWNGVSRYVPGVGDHVDVADLELVARRVALPRRLARQVVGDHRPRQARVGDEAVADRVAEVDDRSPCARSLLERARPCRRRNSFAAAAIDTTSSPPHHSSDPPDLGADRRPDEQAAQRLDHRRDRLVAGDRPAARRQRVDGNERARQVRQEHHREAERVGRLDGRGEQPGGGRQPRDRRGRRGRSRRSQPATRAAWRRAGSRWRSPGRSRASSTRGCAAGWRRRDRSARRRRRIGIVRKRSMTPVTLSVHTPTAVPAAPNIAHSTMIPGTT